MRSKPGKSGASLMNTSDYRKDRNTTFQGVNMRLLVVSGFLGAGKTTFCIQVAREALQRKTKVAIIVNEIGEIGIDDQFMKRLDLNVSEILGGCICCTLKGSLQETLDTVAREYEPELVILELSGVADLVNIDGILKATDSNSFIQVLKITIVDPLRLDMMMTVLTPLITSQIRSAELAVITKNDVADISQVKFAKQTIMALNNDARLFRISSKVGLPDNLVEALLL